MAVGQPDVVEPFGCELPLDRLYGLIGQPMRPSLNQTPGATLPINHRTWGGVLATAMVLFSGLACSSEKTAEPGQAIGGASASGGATLATTAVGGSQSGGATTAAGGAVMTGGAPATGGSSGTTIDPGLPATCGPTGCNAATPVNPQYTSYGALGNVTMYTILASDGGACQYGATSIMYFAASNVNLALGDGKGQWQDGRFCGQCIEVTVLTSQGPKQVVVRIMDRCADEHCGIDLGGSAPAVVMADGFGRYQGAWRSVSCAGHPEVFDGDPSIYVKEGSNAFWSVVQVRNPMAAVTAIDWVKQGDTATKGTLAYAAPSIENYWTVPVDVLQANATYGFTVKYSDGSTGTVTLTSTQLAQAGTGYPLK